MVLLRVFVFLFLVRYGTEGVSGVYNQPSASAPAFRIRSLLERLTIAFRFAFRLAFLDRLDRLDCKTRKYSY